MDTINNNMVFPFSRINVNAMNVTFGQSDTITNRNANYISNNDVFKQIDPDLHMHSIKQQCKSYSEDEFNEKFADSHHILYCIVLYCIMRPYTDGPIGPLSYRHSSGVVRNPHSTLAE